MYPDRKRRGGRGATLIELIMFILVMGAAVAGVLSAINYATRASVDPMIQKQALSIAEAVLEEVQLMPFTYCDPDDAQATTALGAGGCATTAEVIGPEALNAPAGGPVETRLGTVRPFDNVNDYNNFSMAGAVTTLAGNVIAGLNDYAVSVSITGQALGAIPAAESLLISVTVTHHALPGGVVLHGYRARYAPNALP